jgi:hypothetical protein
MIQCNIRDGELAFKSPNFPTARLMYMSATYDQIVNQFFAGLQHLISLFHVAQTSEVPHLQLTGRASASDPSGTT